MAVTVVLNNTFMAKTKDCIEAAVECCWGLVDFVAPKGVNFCFQEEEGS